MDIREIKEKVLKNGGITLTKDLKESEEKEGYFISILGYEKIIKIEDIKEWIDIYKNKLLNNEYIGLWIDKGLLYIDITIHLKSKVRAIEKGIKNKQFAIYDIKNNKSIDLLKDTYILYRYNKLNNDIKYIKEYYDVKDILKDFKTNNVYQFIYKNIDKLNNDFKLLNDKYIIIKDKCYYREYMDIMEG